MVCWMMRKTLQGIHMVRIKIVMAILLIEAMRDNEAVIITRWARGVATESNDGQVLTTMLVMTMILWSRAMAILVPRKRRKKRRDALVMKAMTVRGTPSPALGPGGTGEEGSVTAWRTARIWRLATVPLQGVVGHPVP